MPHRIPSPRKSLRALLRNRSGQALIEAALTLSLLCTMLLGAFELGKVAYAWIEVTRAAKAGVQYGDRNVNDAVDTSGIQTAAANEAPDISGLTTTSSVGCSCSNGGTSTCLNTDCPNSHIIETLTVQTSATYDPGIHLPGLPTTYTLHGKAVQMVLQ
jgi:Flp pilus assembly protein TadG